MIDLVFGTWSGGRNKSKKLLINKNGILKKREGGKMFDLFAQELNGMEFKNNNNNQLSVAGYNIPSLNEFKTIQYFFFLLLHLMFM